MRLLGIGGAGKSRDDEEEARAWIAVTDAALARLDRLAKEPAAQSKEAAEALDRLRDHYQQRRGFWAKGGRKTGGGKADHERRIQRQLLDDARKALIDQRDRAEIDDAVARHVERYLDLQTLLLDYTELDVTESPFDAAPDRPASEG